MEGNRQEEWNEDNDIENKGGRKEVKQRINKKRNDEKECEEKGGGWKRSKSEEQHEAQRETKIRKAWDKQERTCKKKRPEHQIK